MEKKDQFDLNAEASYISLDSAILEARRLARLDDDRYRGRLGWDEIVWTELESQHRDDSYRVVLQFRTPTRDLEQAQIGEEEFIFDLLGTLLDRQVLVWPVSQPGALPVEATDVQPDSPPSELSPEPEEPGSNAEEIPKQPTSRAESEPAATDEVEVGPPPDEPSPEESLAGITSPGDATTPSSRSMYSPPQLETDNSSLDTPIGRTIWATLSVGILLILFDIRNIWDPAFIPGPSPFAMYGIFPSVLRDWALSIFGLSLYGTMLAPVGGGLAGFSVYRLRTRSKRTIVSPGSAPEPQGFLPSLPYVFIGSALGVAVIWLVLQIYPAEQWY